MKVVLIQPSSGNQLLKVPPLGLAYIAAVLKKNNIEIKIVDLSVENVNPYTYLKHEKPNIIGISSIITNASQALELANQTKKVLPESYLVMGGPYPSMMGTRLLTKHREVDATLMGEAEHTFLELVKRLQNNQNISAVDGLVFRQENAVKSNQPPSPISPLDQVPFPAREELKMQLYGENAGVIFTSRGCPQKCIFCNRPVFGRRWRGHSPEYVLKEIGHLKAEYGLSTLSVIDDNFTVDLDRAEKILEGIIAKKWRLGIYFWNGMRTDHITKTLVTKLKQAGCIAINFGVESVDPHVMSSIRKGISLDQIEQAIHLTREAGIRANVFLMIGNPGDTMKSADRIIDFIKKMHIDGVHLSMATPLLGTKLWDWVENNGHWLEYDREELLDWPVDDTDQAYPVFETPDFTAKERSETYRKIRNFLKSREIIL